MPRSSSRSTLRLDDMAVQLVTVGIIIAASITVGLAIVGWLFG